MADERTRGRGDASTHHQGDGAPDAGFGDEQGTRVGRPDPDRASAEPANRADDESTGAGSEAAQGIHSSKSREASEGSATERAHGEPGRGEGAGLSGSEPLRHRETEHKSGYGGEKAEPKTSSDQR